MFDEVKGNGFTGFSNQGGLIRAGVVLAVFTFTVVIAYYALSVPIDAIYSGFEQADFANAETQKDAYMPIIRTATTLFFSILLSLPVIWIVLWCFHREPRYTQVNMNNYSQWKK